MAMDRNADEIVILGALGARWDMTFSNVLILLSPFLHGVPVRILERQYEFFCIHGCQKIDLEEVPGYSVSLIPLAGPVTGIRLKGFVFPLDNETLPMGTTRGISNIFKDEKAEIEIEGGHLLVIIDRKQDSGKLITGSPGSGI
jgi:thiamine pyrophosphokinase